MCQEWGGQEEGYLEGHWGFLTRDRGQGHSWWHGFFFTPGRILWKLCVDIFIRSVSGMGSRKWVHEGRWGFLIGDMEDRVILDVMEDVFYCLRKIPSKFRVDIFIRSISWKGGSRREALGGCWGSWSGTWWTWPSLMSWINMVDPKEDTLKVSCRYLY